MAHLFLHLEERINSKKTPEDIYMILKSVTDSEITLFSSNAEFFGQVHPLDFRIIPRINHINSFRPIIAGSITEDERGTIIDMKAKMHILTSIFLVCWFGMACFFFLCGINAVFIGGFEKIALVLVPLSFIVFGQISMRSGFYGPTQKAFKILKELLC